MLGLRVRPDLPIESCYFHNSSFIGLEMQISGGGSGEPWCDQGQNS
jgi:hypothetical protein